MEFRNIVLIVNQNGSSLEHQGEVRPDMLYGFPFEIREPGEYQLDVSVEGADIILELR